MNLLKNNSIQLPGCPHYCRWQLPSRNQTAPGNGQNSYGESSQSMGRSRNFKSYQNPPCSDPCKFPIATCACETWSLTKTDRKKINAFEMWCWRKMLRIPWTARKTNASVLQEVNPKMRLLEKTNYMALSYFGHVARRENNCLEKVLLQGKIEGSRRPGRPKAKWTDRIKSLVGKPLSTVNQLAVDRNKWSSLMKVTNCQS